MCEAKRDATDTLEITPEMIEAGVSVLTRFDNRFHSEEECVERIYRIMTMVGACHKRPAPPRDTEYANLKDR